MKKIIATLLCIVFLFSFSACSENSDASEPLMDNFTYEQERAIENIIKTDMSKYGFSYSTFVLEKDDVINISISLERTAVGANSVFADTIEWSINAVEKATEEIPFEFGELDVRFVLHDGALDGEICGTMSYTTSDLKKGDVFCATKNFENIRTKKGATITEIKKWLKTN